MKEGKERKRKKQTKKRKKKKEKLKKKKKRLGRKEGTKEGRKSTNLMEEPGDVGQGHRLHLAVQLLWGSRLHHHLPFLGTHRQYGHHRLTCNRKLASQQR